MIHFATSFLIVEMQKRSSTFNLGFLDSALTSGANESRRAISQEKRNLVKYVTSWKNCLLFNRKFQDFLFSVGVALKVILNSNKLQRKYLSG